MLWLLLAALLELPQLELARRLLMLPLPDSELCVADEQPEEVDDLDMFRNCCLLLLLLLLLFGPLCDSVIVSAFLLVASCYVVVVQSARAEMMQKSAARVSPAVCRMTLDRMLMSNVAMNR